MNSRCRLRDLEVTPYAREALRSALAAHLSRAGVRASPHRDAMVNVFLSSTGNETAEEVGRCLAELGLRIPPAMVRNALRLMEWSVASLPHCSGRPEASVGRLVCDSCGKIEEFLDEGLEAARLGATREHDFAVDGHVLELHGRCGACHLSTRSQRVC